MHSLLTQFVRLFLVLTLSVLPLNTMAATDTSVPEADCHAAMKHSNDASTSADQSGHTCCCQQCDQNCSTGCTVTSGIITLFSFMFSNRLSDPYEAIAEPLLTRSSPPHTPPPLALII